MSVSHNLLKSCGGLFLSAALLAGCSPSGKTDPSPSTETEQTSTSEPDGTQSREERVAEAIAEMDAMFEVARSTNGDGQPAMWTLSDEDTTITLFGTVHILKPELEWRTDDFNAAFDAADKLVLELDLHSPEGQREAGKMLLAGMMDDNKTLKDVLSESDYKIVADAAQDVGFPMAALDSMEPWFAALSISQVQWAKDGFDPSSGVEQILIKDAQAQDKAFGFLETIDIQIGVFDNLSQEAQIDLLVDGVMTLDVAGDLLDNLVDEWADGDVTGLGVIAANPEAAGGDEFYDALFKTRNTAWVPQIEAMLDEPGNILVAVGAGHLAGPDSVILMLREKGYTVEGP